MRRQVSSRRHEDSMGIHERLRAIGNPLGPESRNGNSNIRERPPNWIYPSGGAFVALKLGPRLSTSCLAVLLLTVTSLFMPVSTLKHGDHGRY